jgi:translation elongation factor EF-1beta
MKKLPFIKELVEARLFFGPTDLKNRPASEIAEIIYLIFMMLEIIRWQNNSWAKKYADQTMQYNTYDAMHYAGTDLANLLAVLNNQDVFKHDIKVESDVNIPLFQINRYLRGFSSNNSHSDDVRFFWQLEDYLKIYSKPLLRQLRRDAGNWDNLQHKDRVQFIQLLRQLFDKHCSTVDIYLWFKQSFKLKDKLDINEDYRDAELKFIKSGADPIKVKQMITLFKQEKQTGLNLRQLRSKVESLRSEIQTERKQSHIVEDLTNTEDLTTNISLVDNFLSSLTDKEIKFYSIRDNCGPCCLDFISYAAKQGVNLKRVRGEFRVDSVVHDKSDFTPDMKTEFRSSGLNFNDSKDRKHWIEQSKYSESWHLIPHYWCIDSRGIIYDPAGVLQFKNVSSDLSKNRYITEDPISFSVTNNLLIENSNSVSPTFIEQLIQKLHTGPDNLGLVDNDKDTINTLEWINSFDYFVLNTIDINNLSLQHSCVKQEKVHAYAKNTTEYPPIVIDGNNNWIIDGYHRANAAKVRGDIQIKAYIGVNDLNESIYDFGHQNHKYFEGDCPIFAVALNKLTGYPIYALVEEDYNLECNVLIHAYVKAPDGTIIDATGNESTIGDILAELPNEGDAREVQMTVQEVLSIGYDGTTIPNINTVLPIARKVLDNLSEPLNELANNPYTATMLNNKNQINPIGKKIFTFKTESGNDYTVTIKVESEDQLGNKTANISFGLVTARDTNGKITAVSSDVKNTGDAFRVFATVRDLVLRVMNIPDLYTGKLIPFRTMNFTGKSKDPSRIKLYARFAKDAVKYFPGFVFDRSAEVTSSVGEPAVQFILKRVPDELTESLLPNISLHKELNPKLWDGYELKADVKEKLGDIANAFSEFVDIKQLKIVDYIITGSNCAFNYTDKSDVDLHVIVESRLESDCTLLEPFLIAKKSLWNSNHDITIKGYTVELYAEDVAKKDSQLVATGIYSLVTDKWIKRPKFDDKITVDDASVLSKVEDIVNQIDTIIKENPESAETDLDVLRAKIKKMRQSGLDENGEFSVENVTFKVLRNSGIFDKIAEFKKHREDNELSLAEHKLNEIDACDEFIIEDNKTDRLDITMSGDWVIRAYFEATLQEKHQNWVHKARGGNILRGGAMVDFNKNTGEAYLNRIDVSPVSEGFGTELLTYIIAQVKEHNFVSIKAYVEANNIGSKSMLRKVGFTEIKNTKFKDGSYWVLTI